jgi:hypothetical protein
MAERGSRRDLEQIAAVNDGFASEAGRSIRDRQSFSIREAPVGDDHVISGSIEERLGVGNRANRLNHKSNGAKS